MTEVYTIKDVKEVGFALEPLKCVRCDVVGETTYNSYIGDAYCANCGEWQTDDETKEFLFED